MLELTFAIYHRAPSLSSQASSVNVCSSCWRIIRQAPFKHRANESIIDVIILLLATRVALFERLITLRLHAW